MKQKTETENCEAYKYFTDSEDLPLNAALDINRLVVGGPCSSKRCHLSSATPTNQQAVSVYDPVADAPDIGNAQYLALKASIQSAKGTSQPPSPPVPFEGLFGLSDKLENMNNSIMLITPANANECPTPHIRHGGVVVNGKRLTACTWREFLFIILCTILTTLLIIILFLYIGTPKDDICQTVECVETAFKILSGMNQSVNPCEDFYSYSCGGWIEKHHIPPGTNSWTVFSELAQTAEYFAKELLEKEATPNDSRGLQLAKTYFASCINEQAVNNLGLKPIKLILTQLFGGWRLLPENTEGGRSDGGEDVFGVGKYDLTALVQTFLRFGHGVDIFQLLIEKDPRNSQRYAITLAPGELSMLPEYYLDTSDAKIKRVVQHFREFMRTYARMLGVAEPELLAMDAIYELETLMAQNMEPRARQSIETNFFKLNMTELQNFCQVIDWKRLFNGLFSAVNYSITDSETVIIGDYPFFEKRCKVYAEYMASAEKIRVVHDTAIWRTLWSTTPFMPSTLRKEIEVYEQASTGVKEQPQRWLSCVRNTEEYFGMTIARKFVAQHFDERSKEVATKMIGKIKQAFKSSFYQVDWMDDKAKKGAEEKVDMMGDSIGYPDDINDIEKENKPFFAVDSLDNGTFLDNSFTLARSKALILLRKLFDESLKTWDMAPHIVNAFYNPRENHIYFPAGILQKPFYDAYYPLALNYGGIGVVVGHEIVHAFDRQGSKYDAKGNLRQWWSESTRADFEKNSECMVRQYGNYTVQGKNVDGHLTLSENIADNGGIKAAYRAFLKLQGEEGAPHKLPGINLTFNQLFFISFAQVWCKRQLPQAALHTVMFDVHAPERYRVIGTLSNSDDFAEAFSCPRGSCMNPPNKCVLW
uniref:Endothelin converting enzyme 1 n=1 Tax=Echinococcus granulosus TaxID=6210 RepID=A0A068WR49_ECHGR|nr:endothelin converting enzyme 1 [Echinococcus granulosus]